MQKRFFVLAVLWLLALPMLAFGQARSIRSFVESKDKWSDLIGANWRLEGRYAFIGDKTLKFANCTMPFNFGPGVARPPGRFSNLEVTGKIERQSGKLVFVMESIRARPSDEQKVTFEKSKIDIDESQDFYDLALWASQRAKFYEDKELLISSQELQRSGLEVEFHKLKPSDRDGLSNLIKKARDFELDPKLIEEFLHDGYWDRFLYLQDKEPATKISEYSDLLVSLSNDLAGVRKLLEAFDAEYATKYVSEPAATYQSADPPERRMLERYFYIHVAAIKTLSKAEESGKNGLQIAAELQKETPERKELIDQYSELGLKYESARVPVMTRQEMLDLAKLYQDKSQPEQVSKTKQTWLKARESLYKDDGARGLVDYAEEWIQLLDDRKTAAKYYIAAWKQNSQYPLAASWLKQNGYALHEGNWVPAELVPPSMESEIEKAIREGRIQKGMTTIQVKTAMGVAPDSMVRFATNGEVKEIWIYDSSRIIVRFSWKLGDDATIVRSISPLAVRSK